MSQSQIPQDHNGGFKLCVDVEVVFQVADVLFSLPRSQLMTSEFFREMLSSDHIGSQEEGTKDNPIVLEAITVSQVTSFCRVACGRRFDPPPDLTLKEWSGALQIATLWRFEQLRAYIIMSMDSIASDPFDRIQVADDCGLTDWLYPAYARLCARDASLTIEEGRRIGFERFAALGKIREDDFKSTIRSGTRKWYGATNTLENSSGPRANCTSEWCRPRYRLSPREESFLGKIAQSEALKMEGN
ncbi:hypothetical protein M407DRAFT_27529 [Tulasnella calospora MUT 4182]|uniref:BTB domain-containing protein n=1 Tax=Tulasnella calospora MUT 4182 TaxID=1051891 RepID=A0A0C3QCA6_9AGAM|nr:hypothetical protein M407DRAFT_27529 [Tulasnella calospora MUT 4182]